MKNVKIETEYIKLDQFLKWADLVPTGTESRILISGKKIKVNGEIEVRRGKKLRKGDIIEFENNQYQIVD